MFIFRKDFGNFDMSSLHPGRHVIFCAIYYTLLHRSINFAK